MCTVVPLHFLRVNVILELALEPVELPENADECEHVEMKVRTGTMT